MIPTSDLFDSLLSASVNETGHGVALKVGKSNYDLLISHRNLTTYSTQDTLHACPRKFALQKLRAHAGISERISNTTFAFGHAVGAGVAIYDATQDRRQAIWAAFLAWDVDLLAEELNKSGKRTGKSFFEACWALFAYETFYLEAGLDQYESIKIEATVAIDFEDGHFYSGHIDEVLRHKVTGRYKVKENKTTGSYSIDPANYSNSDQALSYAVVIDMLGGSDYDVLYTIYSSSEQEWKSFEFVKQGYKKAEWIQDQLLTHQQLEAYTELNFFPKRGRSCMAFNRRCDFYETCDTSFQHSMGVASFSELPLITSIDYLRNIETIDFSTTLSEIVARQKEMIHGN
jgi:hypothetical protein